VEKIAEYKGVPKLYIILASIIGILVILIIKVPDINTFVILGIAFIELSIMTLFHELLHGLWFKKFTGKVVYGCILKKMVFYASSPNSQIERNKFILIGLFPQLLTLIGVAMIYVSSNDILIYMGSILAISNLMGGISDLWVVCVLSHYSTNTLVEDTKTGFILYEPIAVS
jgi:hypothetical protein